MDRLLQMILRRVIMRLVTRGVDAGMNRMTRGNRARARAPQPSARDRNDHHDDPSLR